MAMSKRSGGEKQEDIWIAHTELAVAPGHPFYKRLNELLEGARFDEFVEGLCARFYHARLGRPSLRPGIYFRALLVGYFEGIDSERGIAWRVADSLALRRFLLIGLDEQTPDHSTISRTRRLINIDTHREVFAWVLALLAERGLLKGQRMGIDATTLEANARCDRSCAGTPGKHMKISCGDWPRRLGSKHRRGRIWHDWTGSARSGHRTKSERVRQTRTHGSRR
jgi:transposase